MAGTAVNGWLYFEAVSIIGLAPGNASTLVVVGMVVGMLGFPIGAWTSEHLGRVPTVAWSGGAAWLGAIWVLFWSGWHHRPSDVLCLLATYCWFKLASSIMTVGANAAATELFPADAAHHDGRMADDHGSGLLDAGAGDDFRADRPAGRTEKVIRYFALLGIPSAILFGAFIDETRGMTLAAASKEALWDRLRGLPKDKPEEKAAENSLK